MRYWRYVCTYNHANTLVPCICVYSLLRDFYQYKQIENQTIIKDVTDKKHFRVLAHSQTLMFTL